MLVHFSCLMSPLQSQPCTSETHCQVAAAAPPSLSLVLDTAPLHGKPFHCPCHTGTGAIPPLVPSGHIGMPLALSSQSSSVSAPSSRVFAAWCAWLGLPE